MSEIQFQAKFVANCLYEGLSEAEATRAFDVVDRFFGTPKAQARALFTDLPT